VRDGDDDVPALVFPFDVAVCLGDLLQREASVDGRPEFSRFGKVRQVVEVAGRQLGGAVVDGEIRSVVFDRRLAGRLQG